MTAKIFFRRVFSESTGALSPVRSPRAVMRIGTILSIALLWLFAQQLSYCQGTENKRILFVGNSYTYFWNLPQQVSAFGEASDISIITRQSTSGGANMGHHWRSERGLKTRDIIKRGHYDAIIFQGHSMSTIDFPDSLVHYTAALSGEIPSDNVEKYVYMTWAREWNPIMQDTIRTVYESLAKRINAEVIPVGIAWTLARQLRPDIDLYDNDGSHPSTLGSYLSACVIYGELTGKSPVGLPHRLISTDKDGEVLYLNIQSKEDAEFCQRVAQATLQQYEQN